MTPGDGMSGGGATAGLSLDCRPGKEGDKLIFPYRIRNGNAIATWVMEGVLSAAQGETDLNTATFIALPDGDEAMIGKLLPPLPTDRKILFPLAPVVRRLEPGQSLEAMLAVKLPLVECNAYLPDLPVRSHNIVDLVSIRVAIAAWSVSEPGLATVPIGGAPGLLRLVGQNLSQCGTSIQAQFPVRKLPMLRRRDEFVRTWRRSP